jgi:hypothetical protein
VKGKGNLLTKTDVGSTACMFPRSLSWLKLHECFYSQCGGE